MQTLIKQHMYINMQTLPGGVNAQCPYAFFSNMNFALHTLFKFLLSFIELIYVSGTLTKALGHLNTVTDHLPSFTCCNKTLLDLTLAYGVLKHGDLLLTIRPLPPPQSYELPINLTAI